MQLFVSGFNGFSQWPIEQNIIKTFEQVDLKSYFKLSDEIKHISYCVNWCYNVFLINGKLYLAGYIDEEHKNKFKMITIPDGITPTEISSNDKYLLIFDKSNSTIWKYDLFKLDNESNWTQIPNFFNTENDLNNGVDEIHSHIHEFILKIACGFTMNICLSSENRLFNIPTLNYTNDVEGKVIDVQCGYEHAALLTDNGKVYTWGCGSRCQLGHGTTENIDQPKLVEALAGIEIVKIASGGWHTCAISVFGDLYTWGWNDRGQLGIYASNNMTSNPSTTIQTEKKSDGSDKILFESIFENNEFFDPIAFQSTSVNLKRSVSEKDINFSVKNIRTDNQKTDVLSSFAIPHLIDIYDYLNDKVLEYNVVDVSCGSKHTVIALDNGSVLGSGCNKYGQLGIDPNIRNNMQYFIPLSIKINNSAVLKCGSWTTTLISLN